MMTFSTFHKIFINVISNIVHRSFELISVSVREYGVDVRRSARGKESKSFSKRQKESHDSSATEARRSHGWSAVKCTFKYSLLYPAPLLLLLLFCSFLAAYNQAVRDKLLSF